MKKFPFVFLTVSLFSYASNAQTTVEEKYIERKLPATDRIKIVQVNPVLMDSKDFKTVSDQYEEKECRKWKLTKAQIIYLFRLSIHYPFSPYSSYSQTKCDITGTLMYNGQKWDFSINGGATSYWKKGKKIKYFGCKDKNCENLFIIPYAPMD